MARTFSRNLIFAWLIWVLPAATGCGGDGNADEDNNNSDTDSDTDSGGNANADGDSDADADTNWGQDTDPDIPVAGTLTPFDANASDLVYHGTWETRYGKPPEIVVAVSNGALDVLAQNYNAAGHHFALLHIKKKTDRFQVTQALTDLPQLDRIMGLSVDGNGNRFYATGVSEDEQIDASYPGLNEYRSDIVRMIKLDAEGTVLFNLDLDIARHEFRNDADKLINPMVASSSRLLYGGGTVALVHGRNGDPDSQIDGTRHQLIAQTFIDAENGDITSVSSIWCSHSFDQRLMFDGNEIIENYLGDAYPRQVVFARGGKDHAVLEIKGPVGENTTWTQLGNMAVIEGDSQWAYLSLNATETTTDVGDTINGNMNLALTRINGATNEPDTSFDAQTLDGATNYMKWLTAYDDASSLHAQRPKLVATGGNEYTVFWEQWRIDENNGGWVNYNGDFEGVYAMRIDHEGNIIAPATLITTDHHLHRGDDAFAFEGNAAWMTGNASEKSLQIHMVDNTLAYTMYTLR